MDMSSELVGGLSIADILARRKAASPLFPFLFQIALNTGSAGEMGVGRVSWCPGSRLGPTERRTAVWSRRSSLYGVGQTGPRDSSRGAVGALFPSTSAGEGEKQPLSLPMIDFRSRAMECTGEAEPSQWLWQVLLAPVSNPPPVAWGRGTLKGSGAKD